MYVFKQPSTGHVWITVFLLDQFLFLLGFSALTFPFLVDFVAVDVVDVVTFVDSPTVAPIELDVTELEARELVD